MLALLIARSVLLVLLLPRLALRRVNYALVATFVLLAPPPGHASIAAVATTALTALALQHHAPTKCLQMADGVI